jgi:undecaprenyl phosphate-alpha-L-ara4N flippase subunit ArnE
MEKVVAIAPVVLLAFAQVLLKLQASKVSPGSADRWDYLKALAVAPGMWAALGLAGAAFVAWMLLLQRYPLSEVYPLISLSFPLVALLGYLILGERINAMQAVGLALIMVGVALSVRYGIARA